MLVSLNRKFTIVISMATCMLVCGFTSELQTLDLKYFIIDVPVDWKYVPQQGIDSFVGEIRGRGIKLSFDCSNMGYASSLIETPQDYITRHVNASYSNLFNQPGVIYTSGKNVENVRRDEMKKLNTNDTSLIKVRPFIRPATRIYLPSGMEVQKFKNADYLVDLTYNDSTITVAVVVPQEIKKHHIEIDTVEQFVVKTIRPKNVGDGITGIYYRKLNSRFDMQISARNLTQPRQTEVLAAFKTIKIKN
jgi:hypothetical protein